jgi:hypothetical protein
MTKQEYEAKRASGRSMGFSPIAEIVNDSMIKDEYIASLEAEVAQLQADNRSLVEQMNQMALKPNQEIIEWHQHSLYPDTSRCCIVECTDNCFYIAHHSDIDGWLHSITYKQLLNVKSWAYLPIGKNYINTQE